MQERPANAINENVKGKERLLIKAIPPHRIEYVKYKERVVWSKVDRLDLVFGTGYEAEGVKIDQVIETYEEWLLLESNQYIIIIAIILTKYEDLMIIIVTP